MTWSQGPSPWRISAAGPRAVRSRRPAAGSMSTNCARCGQVPADMWRPRAIAVPPPPRHNRSPSRRGQHTGRHHGSARHHAGSRPSPSPAVGRSRRPRSRRPATGTTQETPCESKNSWYRLPRKGRSACRHSVAPHVAGTTAVALTVGRTAASGDHDGNRAQEDKHDRRAGRPGGVTEAASGLSYRHRAVSPTSRRRNAPP
jgi:hypothetical protein